MMALGYLEHQIPPWFAPLDEPPVEPVAPIPAGPQPHGGESQLTGGTNKPTNTTDPQTPSTDQQTGSTPSAAETPIDALKKKLWPSGRRVESLSGGALQHWLQEKNIQQVNGGYYENRRLPTGESALVRVHPPEEIIQADLDSENETAELVYRNLDAAQLAILKKVLFNPEAFTYFSWAKSKGHLSEEKDFGDFVNQCIKLTMTKIFGARVAVVVDPDASLLSLLDRRTVEPIIEYPKV